MMPLLPLWFVPTDSSRHTVQPPAEADPAVAVFRATTDCPIPRGWIFAALTTGLVLGYLWSKR